MLSPCPSEARLTALLGDDLPEAERTDLELHLENCAACRERLDRMAVGDGNWVGNARAYVKTGSPIPARDVVERLKSAHPSTAEMKLNPPDPLLASGEGLRRLGDYEVLEELGRGGMGVVFKARQHRLQREVALKVILAGQLASEAQVRRFQLEAEAAARLDHPNIVPIYEIGEHEGRHFFSMKLIKGASLKERRAEFHALPSDSRNTERLQREKTLAWLMARVARAVHHAHQRGILHRDLKPGNVLLDSQGQPHLTDFGLAKVLQSDSNLTLSQAVLGTPEYMSPEQAAGQTRMITTASDVYSLGTILYELLTGRPPFTGEDVMAVLNQVMHEEPKLPRTLNPAVSRDLETICLKCLEKEPARRHSSAGAFADELERFTRGEPIRSRPASMVERVWRWSRRKPALAGALAGLVLVFVLGFAGVAWKWRGEVQQRLLTEQATGQAEQAVVRLEIERAEVQFRDGNSDKSLANLARLLRQQPTNQVVAERLMNALSYRSYCLPVAPLIGEGARLVPNDARGSPRRATLAKLPAIETTAVNFSPDGRLIVTASLDGKARLWDSNTGQPFGEPLEHDGGVLWAQFSTDGTKLVTACEDGAARIWNVQTCKLIAATPKRRVATRYASFNPDGDRIITASDTFNARIWDAKTGQPFGKPFPHNGPVYYAAFSPNGQQVLTAERMIQRGPQAHLWDLKTSRTIDLPHHSRREIRNPFPSFSPAGDLVLVFNEANGFLFSTQYTGEAFPKHKQQFHHDDDVVALAFSPDGRHVATGSRDATAQLWNTTTGEKPTPPFMHKQIVNSVHFSADGRTLLTSSSDRTARHWNVDGSPSPIEPLRHASPVLDALITSNRIVTISEVEGAWLWDVPSGQLPVISWREDRGVNLARFRPDGRTVVSLSRAGVSFSDLRTGRPIRDLITPPKRGKRLPQGPDDDAQNSQLILDIDFSSDGRYLATALEFGNVLLWEPFATNSNSELPIRQPFGFGDGPKLETKAILRVRFSPDDRCLLAASYDGTARLWEIESHRLVFTLPHRGPVNHAEFSPDGKLIATASGDKTAQVWNAVTGKPSTRALNHGAEVNWVKFDPSGTRIATASRDKAVCLWSAQTGEQLLRPLQHVNVLAETQPFDFSPDGKLLATVAGDSLQVWDLATGQTVLGPLRQTALLQSIRFSPDGRKLVTASNDRMARVWDAATGHPLGEPMRHQGRVTYAEFSPDGRRIVTSSWDDHVRVWPVIHASVPVPAWLPDLAEALAGLRIQENDVSEIVPVDHLFQLRLKLHELPQSDYYSRWVHWFLTHGQSKAASDLFDLTVAE